MEVSEGGNIKRQTNAGRLKITTKYLTKIIIFVCRSGVIVYPLAEIME